MGSFTKKDIVLYPFPYTDLSATKIRPCLVLTNMMGSDLILCQISSQKYYDEEFLVKVGKNSLETGSLNKESYIRCNMLFTADICMVDSKLGEISDNMFNDVVTRIRAIFSNL